MISEPLYALRPADGILLPLFRLHRQRYAVYWPVRDERGYVEVRERRELERQEASTLEARTIDRVVIGDKATDGKIRFQQASLKLNLKPEQIASLGETGLPYRTPFQPGPDTMTIRVLVRDAATGNMGTVDLPVVR